MSDLKSVSDCLSAAGVCRLPEAQFSRMSVCQLYFTKRLGGFEGRISECTSVVESSAEVQNCVRNRCHFLHAYICVKKTPLGLSYSRFERD